jgi:hypothetical protein
MGLEMLERLCYAQAMKKKAPVELNKLAAFIVDQITNEEPPPEEKPTKNQAAVELGRLGGKKGGVARALALTAQQRIEIAKKAASVRWRERRDDYETANITAPQFYAGERREDTNKKVKGSA